jgi:hypothetical protein
MEEGKSVSAFLKNMSFLHFLKTTVEGYLSKRKSTLTLWIYGTFSFDTTTAMVHCRA